MKDPSLRTTHCTLLRAATLARNFSANGKKEFEVWTEMHVSVAIRTCLITVECCDFVSNDRFADGRTFCFEPVCPPPCVRQFDVIR